MVQKTVKPEADERHRHPPLMLFAVSYFEWVTFPLAVLMQWSMHMSTGTCLLYCNQSSAPTD